MFPIEFKRYTILVYYEDRESLFLSFTSREKLEAEINRLKKMRHSFVFSREKVDVIAWKEVQIKKFNMIYKLLADVLGKSK